MVMKIRCMACGSGKFYFTDYQAHHDHHHGARCAFCHKPLFYSDLIPATEHGDNLNSTAGSGNGIKDSKQQFKYAGNCQQTNNKNDSDDPKKYFHF